MLNVSNLWIRHYYIYRTACLPAENTPVNFSIQRSNNRAGILAQFIIPLAAEINYS